MINFISAFFIVILIWLIGYTVGVGDGRREVHKQEIICQTMPDKEIYCYLNKNAKEIK